MVSLVYLLSEEEAQVQLKLHVKRSRARRTAFANALEMVKVDMSVLQKPRGRLVKCCEA